MLLKPDENCTIRSNISLAVCLVSDYTQPKMDPCFYSQIILLRLMYALFYGKIRMNFRIYSAIPSFLSHCFVSKASKTS